MSFSRYAIEKKQVSTDRGVTWSDVEPGETRKGGLVGVARTLLECEDMACDLEKYTTTIVEGELPDGFCGSSMAGNGYLPEGIAKVITQTDGAWCCHNWVSVGIYSHNYITDIDAEIARGSRICNGNTCPGWKYDKNILVNGMDVRNTCTEKWCDGYSYGLLCSCFHIDELMPWAQEKEVWKLVQRQHWIRPHCSDEWEMDGEPEICGVAERWKFMYEDYFNRYWQHQVASEFDSNGFPTGWTDEGSLITEKVATIDYLPANMEIIDYVINDGVASAYAAVPYIMADSDDFQSVSGAIASNNNNDNTFYFRLGVNYASGYTNDDRISYDWDGKFNNNKYIYTRWGLPAGRTTALFYNIQYDMHTTVQKYDHRKSEEDETERQNIGYGFKTKRLGSFSDIMADDDSFPTSGGSGESIKEASSTDIWFPYRICQDNGSSDDYWNFSEIGFLRRNGDKKPMEYFIGQYTVDSGSPVNLFSYQNYKIPQMPGNTTSITLRDTITSIPRNKFGGNTSLTGITMPGVKEIGIGAFSGTSNLAISLSFTSPGTTIGSDAFKGSGIVSVDLTNVVHGSETGVFRNCTSLTSVTIGSSIANLHTNYFQGCTSLTSITLPGTMNAVGNVAFADCTSLSSVTMEEGIQQINYISFSGDTSLNSIVIPNSVWYIGNYSFYGCSNLEYVTIKGSQQTGSTISIYEYAFNGCNIKELTLLDTEPPKVYTQSGAWGDNFTFAPGAVILVPAQAVNTYKSNTGNTGWANVKNKIYPIPSETEWVNIGYACVDGLRYDYEHKRGRNTAYSNDWFWLPEYRTVGEPYGECDGSEPY